MRGRRLLALLAVATLGIVLPSHPANAGGVTINQLGSETDLVLDREGRPHPRRGSASAIQCEYFTASPEQVAEGVAPESVQVHNLVEGTEYFYQCMDTAQGGALVQARFFTYMASSAEVGALADEARTKLVPVTPEPQTSPPRGGSPQIVGYPTWMWMDPVGWHAYSATAGLPEGSLFPEFSATAVAMPVSVEWDMGDGAREGTHPVKRCDGPGQPYDVSKDDSQQSSLCTYVYTWSSGATRDGVYHVRATVTWDVTWSSTDGDHGTLSPVTTDAAFDLDVIQYQAVITG